jgi:hypothetical protein
VIPTSPELPAGTVMIKLLPSRDGLTESSGLVSVRLKCTSRTVCRGSVQLIPLSVIDPANGRKWVTISRRSRRTTRLGSRTFRLRPGKETSIKVRLSRRARKLLKKKKKMRVRVVLTVTSNGQKFTTSRVTTLKAKSSRRSRRRSSQRARAKPKPRKKARSRSYARRPH